MPISKEGLLECLRQSSLCCGWFVPKALCPHCQKHKPCWTFFASFHQPGMHSLICLPGLGSASMPGTWYRNQISSHLSPSLERSLFPCCLFSLALLSFCGSVLCLPCFFRQGIKRPGAGFLCGSLNLGMLQPLTSAQGTCCTNSSMFAKWIYLLPRRVKIKLRLIKRGKKPSQIQLDSPLLLLSRNLGRLSIKPHKHFALAVATLGLC